MKPGEFLLPVGLAVLEDQVFVLDGETATVSRLDLAGRYQGRFGGQGLGRGTFQDPKALVAAEGHLFVLDYGNRQVQRLTPEGGTSPATPSAAPARTGPLGSSGVGGGGGQALPLRRGGGQGPGAGPLGAASRLLPPAPSGGEDRMSLVELLPVGRVLYAARRGSSRIHRISLDTGEALPPLEVYAPVRGLALWRRTP